MRHPPQASPAGPDYFEIAPVELRVARDPAGASRVHKFTRSNHLMAMFDAIGRQQLVILSLTEGGQEMPVQHVDALNHYLRSLRGLRSFKRVALMRWNTKWAWAQLREMNNIPTLAFVVTIP
ncbi:MAG TPA: hypothetical protein VG734_19420 [Lacunisphaera sp.]|nr:hypothetical protein [Lacunisphaera sp.]